MKKGFLANGTTIHILNVAKNGKLYPKCLGDRRNTLYYAVETNADVTCKRCLSSIKRK